MLVQFTSTRHRIDSKLLAFERHDVWINLEEELRLWYLDDALRTQIMVSHSYHGDSAKSAILWISAQGFIIKYGAYCLLFQGIMAK